MQITSPIEKTVLWKGLASIMRIILIVCGVCLIILVGMSVFLRYILDTTFVGTDDLIVLFSIWLYWMGGAYGRYEDSHISADLKSVLLKNEKARIIADFVVRLVTTIIAAIFAYWSITEFALWNIQAGTVTTGLRIPLLASNIVLTISFCLMFLYSIFYLLRSIIPLRNGKVTTIDEGGAA
jgi:TRAP-type C4-dicarboxylate transport system permease small subunit